MKVRPVGHAAPGPYRPVDSLSHARLSEIGSLVRSCGEAGAAAPRSRIPGTRRHRIWSTVSSPPTGRTGSGSPTPPASPAARACRTRRRSELPSRSARRAAHVSSRLRCCRALTAAERALGADRRPGRAGDRDRDATGSGVVNLGQRGDLAVGGGDRDQATLLSGQPLRELGRRDPVTGAGMHRDDAVPAADVLPRRQLRRGPDRDRQLRVALDDLVRVAAPDIAQSILNCLQ